MITKGLRENKKLLNEIELNHIEIEDKKSKHDRWINFEHHMRFLLTEINNISNKDYIKMLGLYNNIMSLTFGIECNENNNTFLENCINFLYKDLDYFVNTHKKLKGRLFIIQLFIEDYILSKVQFEL